MVKFDVDLGPAYVLMIVGGIGLICVFLYIIIKILLYMKKSGKKSQEKED